MRSTTSIKRLSPADLPVMFDIINAAAERYRGVIPDYCYHEPYMSREELTREFSAMTFFGWTEDRKIVGVAGFRPVSEVTLIRHAYVLPEYQRKGIGSKLLDHLSSLTGTRRLLVGAWAAAYWALDFYQKYGFKLLPDKDKLLSRYWKISPRQIETSVVLGMELQS